MTILDEYRTLSEGAKVIDWIPEQGDEDIAPGSFVITRKWNTDGELDMNQSLLGLITGVESIGLPKPMEIWDADKIGFLKKRVVPNRKFHFDVVTDDVHTLSDLERAIEHLLQQKKVNDRILERAPEEQSVVENSVSLGEGLRILKDRFEDMASQRQGSGSIFDFQVWAPVSSEKGLPVNINLALNPR